jgi:hypothetical protein
MPARWSTDRIRQDRSAAMSRAVRPPLVVALCPHGKPSGARNKLSNGEFDEIELGVIWLSSAAGVFDITAGKKIIRAAPVGTETCATCADAASGRQRLGPVSGPVAGRSWPRRTCDDLRLVGLKLVFLIVTRAVSLRYPRDEGSDGYDGATRNS